jgi:DNA repair exonuclease SbcCD ATPase subunit
MSDTDADKILADAIIEEIEQAIKEAFAALEGGDAKYYEEFYKSLEAQQEKIAQISGLSKEAIQQIAALIEKQDFIAAANQLERHKFRYLGEEKDQDQTTQKTKEQTKENDKKHDQKLKKDQKEESELEQDEQDINEELNRAKTLAKLSELKSNKNAKQVLKNMLSSMIAARMDPKQRAGETAQSNVKHAQNFGRAGMLTLAMLLKAGVIKNATMVKLESKGLARGDCISLKNVRSMVNQKASSFLELINGCAIKSDSVTKIPAKKDALSALGNVNASMGIFSSKAENLSQNKIKPGPTPFVQQMSNGYGRSM